jgi:hypothetical protein
VRQRAVAHAAHGLEDKVSPAIVSSELAEEANYAAVVPRLQSLELTRRVGLIQCGRRRRSS